MSEKIDKPKNRAWYEAAMAKSNVQYYEGHFAKRNLLLFEMMKPFLPTDLKVSDIASGSCHMAKQFLDLDNVSEYHWSDFNRDLRAEAESRVKSGYLRVDNNFFTHILDAEDTDSLKPLLHNSNVMIGISMEHIERDREMIAELKKGTLIGICSPNFGGGGHVRHFLDQEAFYKRYSDLIDKHELATFYSYKKKGNKKFLLCGERK